VSADHAQQHQDDNHPAHHISHLVAKILPAVQRAMLKDDTEPSLLEKSIVENTLATEQEILSRSFIVRSFANDKKLAVRSAVYCLSTGVVSLID
jgi:carbonic anhydrase